MFEKNKANIMFNKFLGRSSIEGAYARVDESDSWYDTINTVHSSLEQIKKLPSELFEISSAEGYKLKAIYYPCDSSNKTIIFIHGYKSHAERESAFPALFYRSLGYNVLIPYQRAHGISEGKYISFGALERSDLRLWVDKVNSLHSDGSIIIHGFSMGAGIALFSCNMEMKNVSHIIADAPCVSIADVLKSVCKNTFKKGYERVEKHATERFIREFGISPSELDATKTVRESKYPILFTAGSTENMESALAELSNICPTPSRVVILDGCEHGNGMYKQTEAYQSAIVEILKQ